MNNITIEGNLTADPELRFTPTGRAVASFSVAVNRRWTDNNGQQQEETSFIDCEAWQTLGENIVASLSKGDRIIVAGDVKQDTWEAEDGSKRSKLKLRVRSAGAALTFATAAVEKNVRPQNGQPAMAGAPAAPGFDNGGYAEEPF